MEDFKPHLSEITKGALFIAAGVILILHALGLFPSMINTLIVLGGLYLILIGMQKTHYHKKILDLVYTKKDTH